MEIARRIKALYPLTKRVTFFWNTLLIQLSGSESVGTRDLPGRLAGRNISWLIDEEFFDSRYLSKRSVISSPDVVDGTECNPLRAGIRIMCEDGSLSTILGCALKHQDGHYRLS